MYPEFIAIYIGLAILLLVGAANLFLTIKLMLGGDQSHFTSGSSRSFGADTRNNMAIPPEYAPSNNVVFCKRCANEFDASQRFCPKCGTPR